MTIDLELLRASRQSWFDSTAPRVGPYWMQWFWTLVFCLMLALPFTVLGSLSYARHLNEGWLLLYGRNLGVCLVIGTLIHAVFDLLAWALGGLSRARRWPRWQRTAFFSGIPLLCTAVGWPLGMSLFGAPVLRLSSSEFGLRLVLGMVLLALMLAYVFHRYFAIRAAQVDAERRAAEAQLRLLQGQIEPHFLFNTLAGVISLIDSEPAKARRMLEDFTDLLRGSLAGLRTAEGPLADELALAESYLRLMAARMEDRLHWRIEAGEDVQRLRVPPLLLQPLVENAIRHGLEPTLAGGTVSVRARREGGELVLEVHDDGRGPDAPAPAGEPGGQRLALDNIRSRLLARYGSRARLELSAAGPGTRAVLRLPLDGPDTPGSGA